MEVIRNTREHVEEDYRYMLFDELADQYHRGEITLEQVACRYLYETAVSSDSM